MIRRSLTIAAVWLGVAAGTVLAAWLVPAAGMGGGQAGLAFGGITSVQVVTNTCTLPNSSSSTCTAVVTCPAGTKVLAGGWSVTQSNVGIQQNFPSSPTAWTVVGGFTAAASSGKTLTAYATCGT